MHVKLYNIQIINNTKFILQRGWYTNLLKIRENINFSIYFDEDSDIIELHIKFHENRNVHEDFEIFNTPTGAYQ